MIRDSSSRKPLAPTASGFVRSSESLKLLCHEITDKQRWRKFSEPPHEIINVCFDRKCTKPITKQTDRQTYSVTVVRLLLGGIIVKINYSPVLLGIHRENREKG